MKKLYRSETDKVIGGVCGGLGEYLEIDPVILRIIFVVAFLTGGAGFWIYIVLWIVIPSKATATQSQSSKPNEVEDAEIVK